MKDSDRYIKLVLWSDEDNCYIGSSPAFSVAVATARTNAPSSTNSAPLSKKPSNSTTKTAAPSPHLPPTQTSLPASNPPPDTPSDIVALCAFGGGFTFGAAIFGIV